MTDTSIDNITKNIPPEVYSKVTDTSLTTFSKLIRPITAATDGFGKYIEQKFNNMVEVEKSLASYSIQVALKKAEAKAQKKGIKLIPPIHPKSFIKSIEEVSKETNEILHEMWVNLITDQLINEDFHPYFIDILSGFSPSEAHILSTLLPREKLNKNGGWILGHYNEFKYWIKNSGDLELNKWDYSCVHLIQYGLAGVLSHGRDDMYKKEDKVALLFKTTAGELFLSTVSE